MGTTGSHASGDHVRPSLEGRVVEGGIHLLFDSGSSKIGGFGYAPINQFLITIFPNFWYLAKEIFFLIISLVLTYVWVKNISKKDFTKLDILLITLAAFVLVGGTLISQLILMN